MIRIAAEEAWAPKGTTKEKVIETSKVLYTFSFENHDWARFHGAVPVFGAGVATRPGSEDGEPSCA